MKKFITILLLCIIGVGLFIAEAYFEWAGYDEDELAKQNVSGSVAVFGDGTYQIELFYSKDRYVYYLRKVTNPPKTYMIVDEYIVVNNIAYCRGKEKSTNAKKYVILDYRNGIINETYDITEFNNDEQNIFSTCSFIKLDPESKVIDREEYK